MKFITISSTSLLWVLLVCSIHISEAKKKKKEESGEKMSAESSSDDDRQQIFEEGIEDNEGSAQGINPAAVNPYSAQLLLQNQGLLNNPALFAGGNPYTNSAAAGAVGSGNFANLGGGLFSNRPYQLPIAGQGLNGNSFVNAAVGGLNAYQNPLLFGGGNIPGIASPDIFSQSAAAAQLYNNPYLGAQAFGGAGISSGINPLLLRGATNLQYPIVGGNPYLAAQALLSPYSSYNQLNPYNNFPFASRFGIGVGRSSIGSRQNSNSNNNNDE